VIQFDQGGLVVQLHRYLRNEDGATAIEYGLIASLVAIIIIAGLTVAGTSMRTMYSNLATTVTNAGVN
jgi:pilus assembly protein Flp/PilA